MTFLILAIILALIIAALWRFQKWLYSDDERCNKFIDAFLDVWDDGPRF
jgi:hypothetical protein